MDSSTGFIKFIFPDHTRNSSKIPKNFSKTPVNFKAAYESLGPKPYQIFDLLLKEERFTNFFSRIEVYGNNLANLLSRFPDFQKDNYRSSLLREVIGAFTVSLLAERFDDMKSRSAAARIAISAVKLSDPSTLGKLGVILGALPGILRVLVEEGHIKELALTHAKCFEAQAREQWVQFIMGFCRGCEVHGSRPEGAGAGELAKFIRTAPCKLCSKVSFDRGFSMGSEGEPTRARDHLFRSNMELNVLESLLGEPLGPWKIILSQQAMEDLGAENTHGVFRHVRFKFSELASGDWGGKKLFHRFGWGDALSCRIPLFRTFYKTGSFILWQIDTAFDERFGEDYQVIKVWAIGKPKNVGRIVAHIHRVQRAYTKAKVGACDIEILDGQRGVRYPARVYVDDGESCSMGVDVTINEDFGCPTQLAKFYSLTTIVLDSIASPIGKTTYPVAISAEEAQVVDHFVTPAFILGRSGTGKTTCLVYKLVGRYLGSRENGEPLRQVLLTKSKRLASKLRTNTDGLIGAKLGEMNRLAEGSYGKNDEFSDNTKKQFSSLSDADFPLVCTFDYLLRLIENSIRFVSPRLNGSREQENRGRYMEIDSSKCTRVIDFRKFDIEYWEHMSPKLKRGIPVDLAFLEIMGVIKGSVTPATDFEPLSRQDYLEKRWRLAPNFATQKERDAVYDIYEWYERAKKKRGDIDQADRIVRVTKALEVFRSSEIFEDNAFERNIRGILDEIYVDEVQDHRSSEIGLLLTLVGYPQHIHFAGDTAQCISKDALFRFANAKALFYERFRATATSTSDLKPTLLPLSHNFRSHKQILSVASLVMDLLYNGFPELVDKLPPEIGDIPGPKPTLYIGSNIAEILEHIERMRTSRKPDGQSSGRNEYGEVGVILVRDEETRDKLRTKLGTSSLVLTILQSKGMEFEDVFLYNFLSTSPYSHRLDILEELFGRGHRTSPMDHLGPMEEGKNRKRSKLERRAPTGSGSNQSTYQWDHADRAKENIVLCSELKQLYVGVTRARNRLCLLESNPCILNPVQLLFNEKANLLSPRRYPGPLLEILTEKNTGANELYSRFSTGRTIGSSWWCEMGYQMIDDRQYSEALRCFRSAGDIHGITLANAYVSEENGLTNRAHGLFEEAKLSLIQASELFLRARSIEKAVQCRKEGGDPNGAAQILADNGAHEDATWLLAEVGLFLEASKVYTQINKHEKALAAYARGEQFKLMFEYLKRFKSKIEPHCWNQYLRFFYLKEFGESDTIPDEHEKRVLNLIGSPEEQEVVFSRFRLMNKLFDLLCTSEKYMKAYEVGINSGLLESSIQLLSDKLGLNNPNLGHGARLEVLCEFLQAEHIATNPWPTSEDKRIHKALLAVVGRGNSQIDSFVRRWEDIGRAIYSFILSPDKPRAAVGGVGYQRVAGYVNILVTRCVHPDNELRLPLDHIERALGDLRIISSLGTIPYSAQLYCGVYEMPRQPGKYVVLDRSPLRDNSKPRLPLRPADIESLRSRILRRILRDIAPPLVSLEERLRAICSKNGGPQFVPQLKLTEKRSNRVELLVRLCLIFSECSAMIKDNRRPNDSLPQNWNWRLWKVSLLEQMELESSYERTLGVHFDTRFKPGNWMTKYHVLYSTLSENDTAEYRIKLTLQMGVGARVSSLLAQYQTSLFLGHQSRWMGSFRAMCAQTMGLGNSSLHDHSELVTLVNQCLSDTEDDDFPWGFCGNIYKVLGALEKAKDILNFYSPSVISLYEELTLSLVLLLTCPYEFLIPDSWRRLYLNRWKGKPRSPSILKRFWCQRCLARVCLSFCEILEEAIAEDVALARRSVTLIVVCLINLGTLFPRPREYAELWRRSQEVFRCGGLNASAIREVREDDLIVHLAEDLRRYGGNDSICLVRDHKRRVHSFAGIPLEKNGISVVNIRSVREEEGCPSQTLKGMKTRRINAVHALIALRELDRPRFLRFLEIQERKRRLNPKFQYTWSKDLATGIGG
ncbi:unnamed protein product [Tuber aestivum]|uniref:UvrD-like helicase ATP-binding domain-containing protein n=1 Tax=Tuber aestivum TaxID=59557 RepID=A0A292PJA4_9PEZI|nr:unnamed protein product [Tuber aestivum]